MGVAFRAIPLALVVLLGLLAGCAFSPVVERQFRESPAYTVLVKPQGAASVNTDGFKTRLEFEVVSELDLARNSLVQELTQEIVLEYRDGSTSKRAFTLVEAFRLRLAFTDAQGNHYRLQPGQNDMHSIKGLDKLPKDVVGVTVNRHVFAYVANVYGADFTDHGFAHLPMNQDGSVVTQAPEKFNESYQSKHETRGRVEDAADSRGLIYRISYHLARGGGSPRFVVDAAEGFGTVVAPTVVSR
jgi:hypothetical protein